MILKDFDALLDRQASVQVKMITCEAGDHLRVITTKSMSGI